MKVAIQVHFLKYFYWKIALTYAELNADESFDLSLESFAVFKGIQIVRIIIISLLLIYYFIIFIYKFHKSKYCKI